MRSRRQLVPFFLRALEMKGLLRAPLELVGLTLLRTNIDYEVTTALIVPLQRIMNNFVTRKVAVLPFHNI